jgi:hypothetical protein
MQGQERVVSESTEPLVVRNDDSYSDPQDTEDSQPPVIVQIEDHNGRIVDSTKVLDSSIGEGHPSYPPSPVISDTISIYSPDYINVHETKLESIDFEKVAEFFTTHQSIGEFDRYTFFSKEIGTIKGRSIPSFHLERFGDVKQVLEKCHFWVDFLNPTPQDLYAIEKAFDVHPLTIEDIIVDENREKCDVHSNYYFIVIKSFRDEDDYQGLVQPLPVSILVFNHCILSVFYF